MKQSGNWFRYLADGLGSTMGVVDASGNSQKSYQYDVYGEVTGDVVYDGETGQPKRVRKKGFDAGTEPEDLLVNLFDIGCR